MTNRIPFEDWLRHFDREYLSSFVKDGGASVKVLVAPQDMRARIGEGVLSCAERQDYLCFHLDAHESRMHMPQDIVFAMAKQIDWRRLARRAIVRLLAQNAYRTEGVDHAVADGFVESIADINSVDEQMIVASLRPIIAREIFHNAGMSRAFRMAMTHFCLFEIDRAAPADEAQPLIDWLTGVNPRIGAVKHLSIQTPINRTTARYFIESLFHWVHFAGHAGAAVVMDISRVFLVRNPRDGTRYYTRAMVIDHYELLREFIDDVDRLTATALVVIAEDAFTDEHSPRGWAIYPALKTRVMDDVRDQHVANPVSTLVRLAERDV